MKKLQAGEASMEIEIVVTNKEVYYDDYTFYCYSIPRQAGCILALPFFTYDKDGNQNFEGYLIYHDKDAFGYSDQELKVLGLSVIANYSPSGMAGNLSPLPYKNINEDDIEDALDSLIEKNTFTDLSKSLNL